MPACTVWSFRSSARPHWRGRRRTPAAIRPPDAAGPARAWRPPAGRIPTATMTPPIATSSSSSSSSRSPRSSTSTTLPRRPASTSLFVGTGDLSFSLGLRGQQRHPLVEEAACDVLDGRARHGQIAGRPAGTFDETQRYIDAGLSLFPGAVRAGAVRERRAAVSRAARHQTGASPARAVLTCSNRRSEDQEKHIKTPELLISCFFFPDES